MELTKMLDKHIEALLIDGAEETDISRGLLSEECFLEGNSTPVSLLESVRRTIIRRGGVRHVTRRTGRANPYRSAIAKRSAKAHRGSRMRGQMKYRNSAKAKRDKSEIKRFNASRRSTSRPKPKFHGPPRRSTKAKAYRSPKIKSYNRRR